MKPYLFVAQQVHQSGYPYILSQVRKGRSNEFVSRHLKEEPALKKADKIDGKTLVWKAEERKDHDDPLSMNFELLQED